MSARILLFPTGHDAEVGKPIVRAIDYCNDPDIVKAETTALARNATSPEEVVTECMREVLIVCQKYGLVPPQHEFVKNNSMLRDVAFADEAVRAMIYRYCGMSHKWHGMIDRTVKLKNEA